MHHFIIPTKKGKAYHHVTLNDQCEVVYKHNHSIFTRVGNYTKAYIGFLTNIGLNVETIHQNSTTADSIESAKQCLLIDQRLAQIDEWVKNPKDAPHEILERISAIDLYLNK